MKDGEYGRFPMNVPVLAVSRIYEGETMFFLININVC